MQTVTLVLSIIVFALAVLCGFFGVTTIINGMSGNTKYRKMRVHFSNEERARRDRLVAASRFILAAGAVAFGISIIANSNVAEWIGLIFAAVSIVIECSAMRK